MQGHKTTIHYLGENTNLILNDAAAASEWKDSDTGTCSDTIEFTIEFSDVTGVCLEGKCRVNYILLYPIDIVAVQSIAWLDTADRTLTTQGSDFDNKHNITIPGNIILKRLTITFTETTSVCEIVIAGTSPDKYDCLAGYFNHETKVQCLKCGEGTYGDVPGLKSCKQCQKDTYSSAPQTEGTAGTTTCTPCDYIQYSSAGSATCQDCHKDTSYNPACFSSGGSNNLVSSDFGNANLRSFAHAVSGDFLVSDHRMVVNLKYGDPEDVEKPLFIFSVVLIFVQPLDDATQVTWSEHRSCTSTASVPDNTLFLKCDKSQPSSTSFLFELSASITLKKLFVFGIGFGDAPAPEGHVNDGTKFVKCPAGHYSPGGNVTSCIECMENQEQPAAGKGSCENCAEGSYSLAGAINCKTCVYKKDSFACADLSNVCMNVKEIYGNYMYGKEPYNWPIADKGAMISIPCFYNTEESATKKCPQDAADGQYLYEPTVFSKCKTRVTDDINRIDKKSNAISTDSKQIQISEEIKDVTTNHSDVMNTDNVNKTSNIIDNLINYSVIKNESLPDEVKDNILKTVNNVHDKTSSEVLAKGNAASSMTEAVKKLSDKMSTDSDTAVASVYVPQSTVAVAILKPDGISSSTSFSIFGKEGDFTKARLDGLQVQGTVLFSAQVPANKDNSNVAAILYDTAKFYPDENLVNDVGLVLAEQFAQTEEPGRVLRKVISMVTEIKYVGKDESVTFGEGENVELTYAVTGENPVLHYKMYLVTNYECAYYDINIPTSTWITGCETTVAKDEHGVTKVTCRCNHMTSFAVLMSFESDYDSMEDVISQGLLAMSLGCLFCTIIAYLPAKDLLKTRTVRLNLLLVTSMIFSIIIFFFMEVVVSKNIKEGNVPRDKDPATFQCVIIAFLMNYFWLCQMAWMVCEAVVMFRALVSCVVNSHIHRYMLKFNLICWGLPLVFPMAGVIWGRTDFANPKTCFLRKKYGYATFYAPVVLAILFNIFIFLRISWSISRNQNMAVKIRVSDLERRKKQFKFAVTVMSLLGVAWIFGFLLILNGFNVIWLRYLFIIFNSTQGLFIFLLYVILNDSLKKVWKKLLGISDGDKPSNSSVPYSKSKGQKTKQTTFGAGATTTKSISELDPLSSTTSRSPRATGQVRVVQEIDRSRSPSPRSTKITTSLMEPVEEGRMYNSNGVHIYDNLASVIGDTLDSQTMLVTRRQKSLGTTFSDFNQPSNKSKSIKHRKI